MRRRVGARIDEVLAREVEALRARTGQSRSQVVEAALRAWLARHKPRAIFEANGFIGAGVGPTRLARDAKRQLTRSLVSKQRLTRSP